MDILKSFGRRSLLEALQEKLSRNRSLHRSSASAAPRIKLLQAAAILITAWILAWITQASVREQSIREHLTQHWPSRPIWDGSLRELGYLPVSDSNLRVRLLQFYTPEFHSAGSVWIGQEECLILLSQSPLNPDHPELWSCMAKPPPPRKWIKLGSGLLAFQKIPKSQFKSLKPSKKLSNPIDPKEIRY